MNTIITFVNFLDTGLTPEIFMATVGTLISGFIIYLNLKYLLNRGYGLSGLLVRAIFKIK